MIATDWHTAPPDELHHDTLRARLTRDGRTLVLNPYRHRWVDVGHAQTLARATELAIEATLTFDMREDARREIAQRERDRQRGFARDRTTDRDEVREIRRRLDDPAAVVRLLGLEKGARRQPRGVLICCPVHADRTPSCSVRVAGDGTIACVCHGCQWRGDVLALVAAAHKMDVRREFGRVLEAAASIAGITLRRAG